MSDWISQFIKALRLPKLIFEGAIFYLIYLSIPNIYGALLVWLIVLWLIDGYLITFRSRKRLE